MNENCSHFCLVSRGPGTATSREQSLRSREPLKSAMSVDDVGRTEGDSRIKSGSVVRCECKSSAAIPRQFGVIRSFVVQARLRFPADPGLTLLLSYNVGGTFRVSRPDWSQLNISPGIGRCVLTISRSRPPSTRLSEICG